MFNCAVLDYNETTNKVWESRSTYDLIRPYSMIYYIVEGAGQYVINGQCFDFKLNHLNIFPSDTRIALIKDPYKTMTLTFYPCLYRTQTRGIDRD